MSILHLPEEVMIMIIRLLDTQSQHNVYETNNHFKNLVTMHGVVTSCKFSLNTMATVNSLKLDFFKNIAGHLRELNLCAVNDLSKTALMPAMRKLKQLQILDVSYTKINIKDLLDIYQVCPTLKDLTMNFVLERNARSKTPLTKVVEDCHKVFEHFDRLHFVGSIESLFFSMLPSALLQTSNLCELIFTITDCLDRSFAYYQPINKMVQYKLFKIFILNWKVRHEYYGLINESIMLSNLDFRKTEVIMIFRSNLNTRKVRVTRRFEDFFQTNFDVKPEIINEWGSLELAGNIAMMIWNTELTVFDNNFYENLFNQLKHYFPYHVASACSERQVPANNDWFYTKPTQQDFTKLERKLLPEIKRRRLAPQDIVLNYDSVCKEKKKIQVSMIFENPIRCPVTLSSNCDYLRKITYINLTGHVVYTSDFFKTLFSCCSNLVTLNSATTPNAAPALGKHIPLSKSIKNLRLSASTIDFKSIFMSLSRCRSLENVFLINETSDPQDLPEPKELFQKCSSLHNLYILLPMSDSVRTKKIQMLNKCKTMFARHYLNIELYITPEHAGLGYDPFIEVFRLNPLKVLK